MGYTTLYKEDFSRMRWQEMVKDLGLPDDTDEISVKMTSYITKKNRKSIKKYQETVKQ